MVCFLAWDSKNVVKTDFRIEKRWCFFLEAFNYWSRCGGATRRSTAVISKLLLQYTQKEREREASGTCSRQQNRQKYEGKKENFISSLYTTHFPENTRVCDKNIEKEKNIIVFLGSSSTIKFIEIKKCVYYKLSEAV